MNILLVSSYLPYPLFSGGHVRLYNIIRELSKKHEIYLICEKRKHQTKEDIEEVKKFCKKVIVVERRKQWSWDNILKTGFSTLPFLLIGHKSLKMQEEINTLLKIHKFDLIHVETFYVMQNLPKVEVPIVLVEHNIEYLVYARFAKQSSLFFKPLLYIDVLKLKHWEEKYWKKATKLVAVSEQEKNLMRREDVVVVPNGVDVEKFKIKSSPLRSASPSFEGQAKLKVGQGGKTILFIGDFRWIENRDSAQWILKDIWPKIHNSKFMIHNSVKLWIVGKNIPQGIKSLGDENVIFDENAPDQTELIYQKSDLLLAPIRVGGGTSFKILEAMASGVPVITTPLGNAIDVEEDEEILIGETAEDFVKTIKKLLEDRKFYEKIATNARKLVEKKFNWKKIAQDLNSVYESVT